jgi:hypothetical protein
MRKKKWLAELTELKSIFRDCLPIGEETGKVDEYFNSLEEVISTNDYAANPEPLEREAFEHHEHDVQYTYISDALFKERSSGRELWPDRQDVAHQPDVHQGQVPQLGGPLPADLASIPECDGGRDFEYGEEDGDNPGWKS